MASRPLITLTFLLALALTGCHRDPAQGSHSGNQAFPYPASKSWAHCVSTVELGRARAPLFDGMEVDMNYSDWQDRLFMGHNLCDTSWGLTFGMWLDSLPQPVTECLWLDIKNLTPDNASRVAHQVLAAARRHGIVDRVMVEHSHAEALRIVKDSGLHVILWVDNPWWSGSSEEEFRARTQAQIDSLHPDALSGDYHNFPRLPEAFPDQNIHIWDTPREYNDTNVAHSRTIMQHPAVKVVLVDYPLPVDAL